MIELDPIQLRALLVVACFVAATCAALFFGAGWGCCWTLAKLRERRWRRFYARFQARQARRSIRP